MSLVFFSMGVVFILTGIKYTFRRNDKTMKWAGKQSARQEVEITIGRVISIGVGTYCKIMMVILGALFTFFGLVCLAVSGLEK